MVKQNIRFKLYKDYKINKFTLINLSVEQIMV